MPGEVSDPTMLILHALRLLGFAETSRVASRFKLDRGDVEENLLDFEAHGWVTRSEFAGSRGWSLTERGREENGRRLAEELDGCAARSTVLAVHSRFVPLNARFQEAVTRWQIRPLPGDSMGVNDHTDFRWDDRVIDTLRSVGARLSPLQFELATALTRFQGYAQRYNAAMTRVARGENRWVDGLGIDSCHVVWMQLHEDLLASLGLERGDER
ncbi:MAG: transcriptional regulator [Nocardioidaceae bacterium]|nr:transcriptional regulator [Nocardioidaceae bacterium]